MVRNNVKWQETESLAAHGSALGFTTNLAGALTYFLGAVTGIVFLLIERENRFVRFHAWQSIYVSVAFIMLYSLFGMIPIAGWLMAVTLASAGMVLWIILMLNAYNGKLTKVPYIGQLAEKQT